MASSSEQVAVAVFTDTNLATHIAIAVSPQITAGEFKRELERTHFSCFASIGEIKVHGLMVKRKSSFYHLPDTVPIKLAFQGLKGAWFLHAEVRPLTELATPCLSQYKNSKVGENILIGICCNDSPITSSEEDNIISNGKKGRIECPCGKTPLPQELSKNVPWSNAKRKLQFRLPAYSTRRTSKSEAESTEVGKRLVRASKKLSASACKNSSTILLSRMRRKLSHRSTASVPKYLVFEISDQDD